MKEETIESRLIYDGRMIRVKVDKVRLPDGSIGEREIVERINGVSLVPINEAGEVLVMRQYRHAMEEVLWVLPGGGIDDGESPEEAAQRELFEEVGYKARKLELLFRSGGSSTIRQTGYHFLATGLYVPNEKRLVDSGEFLEVYKMPLNDAIQTAMSNNPISPAMVLMLMMAKEKVK